MSEGVVGRILPSNNGGKPFFEIIRRDEDKWKAPPESVRACNHGPFVLDMKWSTVTCKKCEEKLDAFAVVAAFAEWEGEWRRIEGNAERARCQLWVDELRRLRKLRGATDEEVAEIERTLNQSHAMKSSELVEIGDRVRNAISDRKHAQRQARRRPRAMP
jgi:hypothetical protein